MTPDLAAEIRARLVDVPALCRALGLEEGSRRQSGGLLVRCPAHREKTPSCSVTLGPDGTVRAKCFACDWTADALGMIAAAHDLSLPGRFVEVLEIGAELAGLDVPQRRGDRPLPPRPVPSAPPAPPSEPPPVEEVARLWAESVPVDCDRAVTECLAARGLRPSESLARVLLDTVGMPRWARFRGQPWPALGYWVVLPVYDGKGTMRSLRAWRTEGDPSHPKRLPAAGCRSAGYCLANPAAVALLRRESTAPCRVVVVEGEPDWLTWCARAPELAVFGVGSGWWTAEHAAAIPDSSVVVVRTHRDQAGDRYADGIAHTLAHRPLEIRRTAA